MAPLEPLDIANGIFGMIFIVISMIVGFSIIAKYFKNKNVNLLYVGITWLFVCSAWWGVSTSFIVAFFNGGEGLTLTVILLINFVPLPIGLLSWMMAFTNFLYKEKQKVIFLCIIAYIVFFYSIFFFLVFTDVTQVATKISAVDTQSENPIMVACLLGFIFILLTTGVTFAIKTIKLDDPDMKLKGKLLLVAFPAFSIGALMDAAIPTTAVTLVIFRILLIISAFLFYGGFILPDWMKKLFKK
jgi:hypothetical protein